MLCKFSIVRQYVLRVFVVEACFGVIVFTYYLLFGGFNYEATTSYALYTLTICFQVFGGNKTYVNPNSLIFKLSATF